MNFVHRKLFTFVIFVVLLLAAVFVTATAATEKMAPRGEPGSTVGDNQFSMIGGDVTTFTGGGPGALINQTINESFLVPDSNRKPLPALAKKYVIGTGWKYIDLFLDPTAKFHNGDPVTIEDHVFTIEQYLKDGTKYLFKPLWKRVIKDMEIINPTTLRINLKTADWGFLGRRWWGGGGVAHQKPERVGDEGFANKPIGAGPFKWVDFKQDQWFKITAVEGHYRQTPEVKDIKVILVPEHSTRLAMLKAGEIDLTSLIGPHAPQVEKDPNLTLDWVKYVTGSCMVYCDLSFPDEPSPFHNIKVRRAVSLAIDRKTICEKLKFGGSEPWGEVLAPITLGFDPSIKPDPYDPERAKQMLVEAGYPNGFETVFNTSVTGTDAEAIQANLAEIGIKAKIQKYEGGAWVDVLLNKKIKGLYISSSWYDAEYQAPADLSDFYLSYMPWTYNTTPEIQKAIQTGMFAETDEQLAIEGRKISKLIRDSGIRTMLWANHYPWGMSKKIKSWRPQIGANPPSGYEFIKLN